jgi:hypothetical protein
MSSRRYYILLAFDSRQGQDQALAEIERVPPAGLVQATDYNPRRRCQRIRNNTIGRRRTEQDRLRAKALREFAKTQCYVDPRRTWAEENSLKRCASWVSCRQVYEAFRRWAELHALPVSIPFTGFCMLIAPMMPKNVEQGTRTFDGVTLLGWNYLCVNGIDP